MPRGVKNKIKREEDTRKPFVWRFLVPHEGW